MARTWAIDKRLAEERARNEQKVNPEPRQPAEQHQASGERREAVPRGANVHKGGGPGPSKPAPASQPKGQTY